MMDIIPESGLALGEWLDDLNRPLRWACDRLMDAARVDAYLRPGEVFIMPTRNTRWGGWATPGRIRLRGDLARALSQSNDAGAGAVFLHEVGHVTLYHLNLNPVAVPERLLRVAPTLASGGHDPVFAALVGVFYQRAGILDVQINSYDCGWSSEGALDWPGPDWSLDWAHDFSQRHWADEGDVATLVRTAIREFESEFFAREARRRWPWRRSENAFTIAAIWRRHR